MEIGFYVPCYNAQDHIEAVLQAILGQTLKPADVLVVDDGSSDQSLALAKKYPVRVIEHRANKGLAEARNTAIANLQTDYIASVDADCVPEPDWLQTTMQGFDSPGIAGVGGSLKEVHDKSACDKWRTVHMGQSWSEEEQSPEFLFGSNTVFKRDVLVRIGGYDRRFRNNFEDVDICRRIKAQGKKFAYKPKAVVKHLKKDSVSTLLSTYWKWRFPFYQQEDFYSDINAFKTKIADNMGLANRYMVADRQEGRQDLLYIDFLLAFDHCLRDFKYYIEKEHGFSCDVSRAAVWMSLYDLVFFYHFDKQAEQLNTLLPRENIVSQNLAAVMLIFGRMLSDRFQDPGFAGLLWKDLLESFSRINDREIADKISGLISNQGLWSDFLEKPQENLDSSFLRCIDREFNRWFNSLTAEHKDIIGLIKAAAKTLHENI